MKTAILDVFYVTPQILRVKITDAQVQRWEGLFGRISHLRLLSKAFSIVPNIAQLPMPTRGPTSVRSPNPQRPFVSLMFYPV